MATPELKGEGMLLARNRFLTPRPSTDAWYLRHREASRGNASDGNAEG
jgi:cobalamin-dependent methionine synthase I